MEKKKADSFSVRMRVGGRAGWVINQSSCLHFDDQCASFFQAEPHASIFLECLPQGHLIY